MQLFLRCGGAVGVVPVQAHPEETFQQLMSALGVNSTAAKCSLVRTLLYCCSFLALPEYTNVLLHGV